MVNKLKRLEEKVEYVRGDVVKVDKGIRDLIEQLGQRDKITQNSINKFVIGTEQDIDKLKLDFSSVKQKLCAFKSEIDKVINRFGYLENHMKINEERLLKSLKKEKSTNHPKVTTHHPLQNLSKNVVIHGLKYNEHDPVQWLWNFCHHHLGINIELEDAQFRRTRKGYWICIAKLKNKTDKAKLFRNCHKLKNKALGISICDDLDKMERACKNKLTKHLISYKEKIIPTSRKNDESENRIKNSKQEKGRFLKYAHIIPTYTQEEMKNLSKELKLESVGTFPTEQEVDSQVTCDENYSSVGKCKQQPNQKATSSRASEPEKNKPVTIANTISGIMSEWIEQLNLETLKKSLRYIAGVYRKTKEYGMDDTCLCENTDNLVNCNDRVLKAIKVSREDFVIVIESIAKLRRTIAKELGLDKCICKHMNLELLIEECVNNSIVKEE